MKKEFEVTDKAGDKIDGQRVGPKAKIELDEAVAAYYLTLGHLVPSKVIDNDKSKKASAIEPPKAQAQSGK